LTDQLTQEFEEGKSVLQLSSKTYVSINISSNPKITDRGLEYLAYSLLKPGDKVALAGGFRCSIIVTSLIARDLPRVTDKISLLVESLTFVSTTCDLNADEGGEAKDRLDFVDFTGCARVHKYLRRLNRWKQGT
jgi:hypothetical protein